MSKWSKLPPRQAGIFWFRGARITRGTQRVALNEPVRLQWIPNGKDSELTVILLGTQRKHSLSALDGEWRALEEETLPADIKRTLLDAIKTEEEDFGKTAETVNARLWVNGNLEGPQNVR